MIKYLKITAFIYLFACTTICHAITIHVQTDSKKVYALGFIVNGLKHGGPGNSYSATNMPANARYIFGVRIGGYFNSEDIRCVTTRNHRNSVVLSADSSVRLMYDDAKKMCWFFLELQR